MSHSIDVFAELVCVRRTADDLLEACRKIVQTIGIMVITIVLTPVKRRDNRKAYDSPSMKICWLVRASCPGFRTNVFMVASRYSINLSS